MKKFANKDTGEIISGTFKEANKKVKETGCDWIFIKEDNPKRGELFSSIEEFTN